MSKIIFTDSGKDKAITGQIIDEDDFFITIQKENRMYRIGKKAIICAEEDIDK